MQQRLTKQNAHTEFGMICFKHLAKYLHKNVELMRFMEDLKLLNKNLSENEKLKIFKLILNKLIYSGDIVFEDKKFNFYHKIFSNQNKLTVSANVNYCSVEDLLKNNVLGVEYFGPAGEENIEKIYKLDRDFFNIILRGFKELLINLYDNKEKITL